MISKSQLLMRALLAGGLALSVSACGSNNSSSSQTTPPTVTTTAQEDKFGTAFGTDFRASNNSEPANVSDGDVVAVSLTTEPVNIQ